MDTETRDMFVKILEGQSKIGTDITGIKTEMNGLKEEVNELKGEVKRNSIKLETIEKHISIIAEVQTSHMEQNTRGHEEINLLINEKSDLVETAITNTTKEIIEVKESVEVIKEMTGKHEVDINILKRRVV